MLEVKDISYSIGQKDILQNVSAQFEAGKLTMILGPNGSGKSSLLKIISHEISNYQGDVYYNSQLLTKKQRQDIAKVRAVLSQESELSFPLTVEEVVMMGRYPHFNFKPSTKDVFICKDALARMKMESFSERNYLTLSGGEKQRVHFARVLAQIWEPSENNNRYLLLDEPIASLDLNYQHEFLRISKDIAAQNTVVVAVIHDINLAFYYADNVILLQDGQIMASGKPEDVITPENLFKLYGISCRVVKDLGTLKHYYIPN